MSKGKFGLRIIYKDGKKDFQWYIEEKLRNSELRRYRKHWGVQKVIKVNRKSGV